ncbi:LysR family substrate-binding domain-containing protein [Burkholderia pseudomallei]|uniref:LysR family substrate-binding domain-containing protein n=1 Tax=Burkholderia pseudomallei TaxID=28450 RepID=UPI000F07894D|nr:LysR family substrate-binding domain-containing protein [Burkholderia pseudomallei]
MSYRGNSKSIRATPVWRDPLVVAVPARHPLLKHTRIPLEDVLRYPLVLCHPETCEGSRRQIDRVLRMVDSEPIVADHVTTHDMLIALVAAGYGIGLTNATHVEDFSHADVVVRPLAGRSVSLTTYILRPQGEPSETLRNFIERLKPDIDST